MKKIILSISVLLLLYPATAQKIMQKAIHHYYRYYPFERSFSSFITNLLNDPALENKTVVKRTDSTLFFVKGEYSGHHPFGFKALRTEMRLAELILENNDSIPKKDTIMAYQILGYCARTENGMQSVKSEYARFDRKYGEEFPDKKPKDLMEGGKVSGATCNYFLENSSISPLTVLWGNISDTECIFAITLRFIKIGNEAFLPMVYDAAHEPL
jgi:hypothetical protein